MCIWIYFLKCREIDAYQYELRINFTPRHLGFQRINYLKQNGLKVSRDILLLVKIVWSASNILKKPQSFKLIKLHPKLDQLQNMKESIRNYHM